MIIIERFRQIQKCICHTKVYTEAVAVEFVFVCHGKRLDVSHRSVVSDRNQNDL